MIKKYEWLKDDYISHAGNILYRIKALKEFGNLKAGDLGGYIQSEYNLRHVGNCWVYNKAKVCVNARVYDNAKICNNAKIYNNAQIYNNAEVFNDAIISGYAKIYNNAEIYNNAVIFGQAKIYNNAIICSKAKIYDNAEVYGCTEIHCNARIFNNANIPNGNIIGNVSMPYKDIFQHQCDNRILTAILTENNEILYSIGCQDNITEKKFIDRIHNDNGGLKENPHREKYLKFIKMINIYFKGE